MKSRLHTIITVAAAVAWVVVAAMILTGPRVNGPARLVFFGVLGLAIALLTLALLPWLLLDLLGPQLRNYVGAFLAGYLTQHDDDHGPREPTLRLVPAKEAGGGPRSHG